MSEFVSVRGYEGYYKINQQGEVLSSYYGIILKHGRAEGYPVVRLYRPGCKAKGHTIHRLLAEHFIPNPSNLPQVNHKDGNRENFELDNLEWCTAKQNIQHAVDELGKRPWNTGMSFVDRRKTCENCKKSFNYKRKSTRFCSTSCSAKWRIQKYPHTINRERNPINGRLKAIELFKAGILKTEGKE